MMIFDKTLGFIGAGRIANALISGLVQQDYPSELITVSNPHEEKLTLLKDHYAVQVTTDNTVCARQADVLILAVKPAMIVPVLKEIRSHITAETVIVSVAAGVRLQTMQVCLPPSTAIVRVMPNTPATIAESASILLANEAASREACNYIRALFNAVGSTTWVKEEDIFDKLTTVVGSGPAYLFYLLETWISAAENMGLSSAVAKKMIVQTVSGSVKLAAQSELSLSALRQEVTSPGGTTAAAIVVLESGALPELFTQAFERAYARCRELGESVNS